MATKMVYDGLSFDRHTHYEKIQSEFNWTIHYCEFRIRKVSISSTMDFFHANYGLYFPSHRFLTGYNCSVIITIESMVHSSQGPYSLKRHLFYEQNLSYLPGPTLSDHSKIFPFLARKFRINLLETKKASMMKFNICEIILATAKRQTKLKVKISIF